MNSKNIEILPPLHNACIHGNLETVEELLIEDRDSINLILENNETALSITINAFYNSNITNEGNLTPKYWDNPYVQIIVLLIKNGVEFNAELLHVCLFSEKPIFTIDDFFTIYTNPDNKFPLHSSIELSNLCNVNMEIHDCFKKDYIYLQKLFKDFTSDLLDKCHNNSEAKNVILLEKDTKNCIDIALEIEDKEFISHKYVQTEFEEKWRGNTNNLSFSEKLIYTLLPFHCDKEWYTIPCIKYYVHTIFNIIFLILLYIQTYTLTKITPDITELIISIWVVGMIISEINQFRSFKLGIYLSDKWNYFDIFILFIFLTIIIIRFGLYLTYTEGATPDLLIVAEQLMGINIIFSFLRILNVCNIHPVLGPLLFMLRKMISDMIMFFCILSVFLGGFSLGLTKIYHRIGDISELNTISSTTMKLFCALFGDFEMDDFKVSDNLLIEYTGSSIFILYLVIAAIILINLFIAMLSNTYAIIQEDAEKEWKYSRVSLIITYSKYSSIPPPLNIISIMYSCFNNAQIEPSVYMIDLNNDSLQLTQKLLNRYHQKKNCTSVEKQEIHEVHDMQEMQKNIDSLTKDVQKLTAFLTEHCEIYTPNSNITNSSNDTF